MFIGKTRFAAVVCAIAAVSLLSFNGCSSKKKAAQKAANRGFHTITTPASELEDIKAKMEKNFIPAGIGIGESSDEQVARNIAADEARSDVARAINTQVQRLSESYAQNVDGEAKKIWEEVVRQVTNEHVRGSSVFKNVVQYNSQVNRYKVYALVILNPEVFKNAVLDATDRDQEFELRVKKDEMLRRLDAGVAEYDAKYRNKQ
ncbi:MAG: hypothetical protein FWE57_03215 [Chitinispirillia bacterium]|nr:hypothetical protein [Chitinispirillia bacterium]